MDYIYVWEYYGGGRHIDLAWSPIFEDLYSPKLDFMDTRASSVFSLFILDHRFSDAPTHIIIHNRLPLSVERCENLVIRKPPGKRGSACVEVMTTLHGSTPFLRRRTEGYVP